MNKKITLLLLGVITCAMGIVLFLQMKQGNTEGVPSNQGTLLSPIEQTSRPVSTTVVTAPVSNATIKSPLPTESTPQIPVALEEKAPIQQKDILQEKSTDQKKTPEQVKVAQDTTAKALVVQEEKKKEIIPLSSPENSKKINQTKEKTTKKIVPTSKEKRPVVAGKSDISSGTKGTHEMSSLAVKLSGATVHVIIKANNTFAYKTMLLSSPDRLVIDLPGTWKKVANVTTPKNRLMEKIRIGSQPLGPRMVLDLKTKPKKYNVYKVDSSTLEIVIE